ncbi:hypothetical protein OWR29_26110 [Actinoplanes sp. Pm04-4]|uniref:Uncharacterized protein n=1 Tax=Paractinoplanes pyxinae TaxID=2997416 RepID=A0ABT4B4S0_9ACTN|nr:hypothetical protein [Actinoplanes pyxinae]MCY1141486.1 hypothetical protein [Actinoplanes pyxinae]
MSTAAWLRAVTRAAQTPLPPPAAVNDGDRPAAMAGLDPITAPADADIVAAALAHARDTSADRESRLLWGRYAYHNARTLFGDLHPAAVAASRIYQRILAEQQFTFDAVRVAQQRLHAFERARDQVQTLTSRCSYATALHRDGDCEQAEQQTALALRTWWASPHGLGHSAMVLLSAAAIRAGCGRTRTAVTTLVDHAAHLAHLDGSCRRMAARWLATIATTHPQQCQYTSAAASPDRDVLQQQVFWLSVLQTPQLHQRRSLDHQTGQIS